MSGLAGSVCWTVRQVDASCWELRVFGMVWGGFGFSLGSYGLVVLKLWLKP